MIPTGSNAHRKQGPKTNPTSLPITHRTFHLPKRGKWYLYATHIDWQGFNVHRSQANISAITHNLKVGLTDPNNIPYLSPLVLHWNKQEFFLFSNYFCQTKGYTKTLVLQDPTGFHRKMSFFPINEFVFLCETDFGRTRFWPIWNRWLIRQSEIRFICQTQGAKGGNWNPVAPRNKNQYVRQLRCPMGRTPLGGRVPLGDATQLRCGMGRPVRDATNEKLASLLREGKAASIRRFGVKSIAPWTTSIWGWFFFENADLHKLRQDSGALVLVWRTRGKSCNFVFQCGSLVSFFCHGETTVSPMTTFRETRAWSVPFRVSYPWSKFEPSAAGYFAACAGGILYRRKGGLRAVSIVHTCAAICILRATHSALVSPTRKGVDLQWFAWRVEFGAKMSSKRWQKIGEKSLESLAGKLCMSGVLWDTQNHEPPVFGQTAHKPKPTTLVATKKDFAPLLQFCSRTRWTTHGRHTRTHTHMGTHTHTFDLVERMGVSCIFCLLRFLTHSLEGFLRLATTVWTRLRLTQLSSCDTQTWMWKAKKTWTLSPREKVDTV